MVHDYLVSVLQCLAKIQAGQQDRDRLHKMRVQEMGMSDRMDFLVSCVKEILDRVAEDGTYNRAAYKLESIIQGERKQWEKDQVTISEISQREDWQAMQVDDSFNTGE